MNLAVNVRQDNDEVFSIFLNEEHLYEGNLMHYVYVLFCSARSLRPSRLTYLHMTYVLGLCYKDCKDQRGILSSREMRSILIAAIFRNFRSTDEVVSKEATIRRAVSALDRYLLPMDVGYKEEIQQLVTGVKYPSDEPVEESWLAMQILRNAKA